MCIFLHENRLGIKEKSISFLTCYARTLAQKFRVPYHSNHVIPPRGFVSSKIFDKRDDFDFDIVNFPFLDGDVPRTTSYGVYISQLIRFARVSSHLADFNARNKSLTAKLLQPGNRSHKLRTGFLNLIVNTLN